MGQGKMVLWLVAVAVLLAGCQSSPKTSGSAAPGLADGGYVLHKAPDGLSAPISPLSSPDATVAIHPVPPVGTDSYQPPVLPVLVASAGWTDAGWVGAEGVPAPFVRTAPGPSFAWSETENFLVLGTDRVGSGGSWRTDTIMVVGIDRANGRVAVLSIPRDLYVEIPGYGWSRINTADYIGEKILPIEGGGPALVSQILNNTFGISTDHWVRMEMNGFKSVVDSIGGVTIHLDCPFYEPIFNLTTNSWDYFTLPAGDVWMDGETAYFFVRLRLRESDIGRSKRQRQFLWALRDQASNANLLLRAPELWSAFQETFSTDLSLLQLVDYAQLALSVDAGNVRAAGISLADLQSYTTSQGASVLRIADQARVQRVVDGIWNAPAMADAYRQDAANCAPIPVGAAIDNVPGEVQTAVAPQVDEVQAEGEQAGSEQAGAEQPASN
jgi:LCP family protein required for cell wall assembly